MCVSYLSRVRAPSLATFAEVPDGVDLRHALLDGTVADDIDNVTNLVLTKVGGQSDHALLLEIAREGCVAESALVFTLSHVWRRIVPSATVLPMLPSHAHTCPPSFFHSRRRGVRLTIASALPETG
jgi:hypothetical protein